MLASEMRAVMQMQLWFKAERAPFQRKSQRHAKRPLAALAMQATLVHQHVLKERHPFTGLGSGHQLYVDGAARRAVRLREFREDSAGVLLHEAFGFSFRRYMRTSENLPISLYAEVILIRMADL